MYLENLGGVLDDVISRLKLNKCCYMDTDCSQISDYIYINDCIDALLLGIQKELHYGFYNISSGNKYTLKEYLEKIKIITGLDGRIEYGTHKDTTSPDFQFSSERFRNETGWIPKYSFEDGIKDMIS